MMFATIVSVLSIACAAQAVTITVGPTSRTVEVGRDFTLSCSVSNKLSTETVFWKLFPHNTASTVLLTLDRTSKDPERYNLQDNTYNLEVKNATYVQDGIYECEAGTAKRSARVYVYDKPDNISLEWQHAKNGPGAVEASKSYKLKCVTKNSHPPASHRYFKEGVELSGSITYEFNNYTDTAKGYGDTTSYLDFTPSADDVFKMATIRCDADQYTQKSTLSDSFKINSAHRVSTLGLGMILAMAVGYALL